ncbi:MAG: B12-binding domain-containing radical SAM protein [bacterium]|nr:B12-binding domain-containing radical SAM protein [bacterium]MDZ4284924.1 B12-binding domain-containing radical SAM protein [Patescibacteria group bacterium]
MNILLVYPKMPPSFWSFTYALRLIGKKAAMPPLGLLTVAGLIPQERHGLRLIDMNVGELTDADLAWADAVFISAMIVQRDSLRDVARRAKQMGKVTVAGGPYPTSYVGSDELRDIDHLVLDEVEETLPGFLKDLEHDTAEPVYRAPLKPSITASPLPRYDLINLNDYATMQVQFSRGCPKNCDFCDITKLYGRIPRTKSPVQILAEFEQLYQLGWGGPLFMVDDNFIGNWREALELLGPVRQWQQEHNYPFRFHTEASVDLVRHEALMDAMAAAGFDTVFVGLETPNEDALRTMQKHQNVKKGDPDYLERSVRTLQGKGFEVTAGFILGVDNDAENPFDPMIEFVQRGGIPMAMVSPLNVLKGTDLEHRLEREGRLRGNPVGTNFELILNFVPQMDPQVLLDGYKRVLDTLYDAKLKNYFERCLTLFEHLDRSRQPKLSSKPSWHSEPGSVLRRALREIPPAILVSALKFLVRVLLRHPAHFTEALTFVAKGHHFRQMTEQLLLAEAFELCVHRELRAIVAELAKRAVLHTREEQEQFRLYLDGRIALIRKEYAKIHADFKYRTARTVATFLGTLQDELRRYGAVISLPTAL